jgi:hypothetical protein
MELQSKTLGTPQHRQQTPVREAQLHIQGASCPLDCLKRLLRTYLESVRVGNYKVLCLMPEL